jgi:hypothetical protein
VRGRAWMRSQNWSSASLWLFDGGTFSDFGRFSPIWVDFVNFRQPFFPFLSFFELGHTVYSQMKSHPDV